MNKAQTNIEKTKSFVRAIGGSKHSLGQHFLLDESVVRRMVEAAGVLNSDTILEIGPGLGVLTKKLTDSPASTIILCEKDRKLYEFLLENFKSKRIKTICADALLLIPSLQVVPPFKVVSNLPYNISSSCIISLLTVCQTLPKTMVLMLQKEVAERICAEPGCSNRGLLTVLIELVGEAKIIEEVPKEKFYPQPAVTSSILSISNIKKSPFDLKAAIKIIKLSFAGKRKKIKNSLFASLKIDNKKSEEIAAQAGISLDLRPEDLNREQWQKLILELEGYFIKRDKI